MKNLFIISVLCVVFSSAKVTVQAQDTISVMYYNLLNYPLFAPERADTLKKIVQYVLPDLFLVNELNSQTGATYILNSALNQNGITYYQQANFVDGYDTDNLLFYNSEKIGLKSQAEIATDLRDVNEYVVYYKAPDLATTNDTVFFYLYSCHLKAGNLSSNEDQRYTEVVSIKNYMSTRQGIQNVMIGGDFNFYGDYEAGFTQLLNGASPKLYDPIAQEGNWHANVNYKDIHTQSTRDQESINNGATGGLDDRFDFIFISNDLQTGSAKAQAMANTYKAVGQDGLHYNNSLASSPSNGQVPDEIALALRNMSDHLPVYMEIAVGGDVGITENDFVTNFRFNSESHQFKVYLKNKEEKINLSVYDLMGKLIVSETSQQTTQVETTFSNLKSGIYIIELSNGTSTTSIKVVAL